jgi:hypothetical protein
MENETCAFLLILLLQGVLGREPKVGLLVEGGKLSYANQVNITTFNLNIEINFDAVSAQQLRTDLDTMLTKWSNYSAFKENQKLAQIYLGLMHMGLRNLQESHHFMSQILTYITEDTNMPPLDTCTHTVTGITASELKVLASNLNTAWEKCDPTWTPAEIRSDRSKDNTLGMFARTLDAEMENLYADTSVTFTLLDNLSAGKFPEQLMGLYQSTTCIGQKLNEDVIVKYCTGYKNMYSCAIEVREPTNIQHVIHMIPVHYNRVALRGNTDSQLFIKSQMGSRTQLLDCDIAAHDRVEINVCETIPWHAQCEAAVTAINIAEIVSHCNFTKHEKNETGIVRHDESVLVQGMDVKTRFRKNSDIRIVNNEAPLIIYTNGEIILEENGETYVFLRLKIPISDEIIVSALDKNDIKKLESAYFWQNFWHNFDIEDIIDVVLIAVEFIMLPTSIVGLVYGILAARAEKKKETKKKNYEHNRLMLKHRRPSPYRK